MYVKMGFNTLIFFLIYHWTFKCDNQAPMNEKQVAVQIVQNNYLPYQFLAVTETDVSTLYFCPKEAGRKISDRNQGTLQCLILYH